MSKFFQRAGLLILLVLLTGLFGGCASDKSVIGQANEFHDTLEPAVISDPELANYIQSVGDRVIAAAKKLDKGDFGPPAHTKTDSSWMYSKDMKFHFVNSKTVNAFTTGGEHMYIYTSLFEMCKTEDELAAVVAHEYAHVFSRHVQKGMNRQYAILAAAGAAGAAGYAYGGKEKGGDYAGAAAGAALLAGQFVGMHYTRGDEAQADEYGFKFYTQAGWDPKRFGDFFQAMIDKGYDKGNEMLSDHPSLKSRVEQSKKWAAELPPSADKFAKPPIANPSKLAQLQARAKTVGTKMPDDASLAKTQKLLQAWSRSCLTPAIREDQKKAEQEVLVEAEKARKKK